jgi:S-formylglutathione hydrolase FrmB
LSDRSEWAQYDATELMSGLTEEARGAFDEILVDVGTADSFLTGGQLLPEVSARLYA